MLPFIALIVILSRWSGGLVATIGTRPLLVVGPAIAALGCVLFALPGVGGSYWTTFFPAMLTFGLGMAVTVAPLTSAVMDAVDERRLGIASAINNAVSRTGGLIAVAAMSAVVVATYSQQLDKHLSALNVAPPVTKAVRERSAAMAAAEIPPGVGEPAKTNLRIAMDDSFVYAFRVAALIGAGMAAASSVVALFTIGGMTKVRK
jgi:MFS family permease